MSPRPTNRHRFTEKAFAPYVTGIGQTVLAWNDLQEELGRLYSKIMESPWYLLKKGEDISVTNMALESWQVLKMDRAKRDMLGAAVKILHPHDVRRFPKLVDDVAHIIKETNSLEDTRNDAIHAPLRIWHSEQDDKRTTGIEAADLFANRRARKIAKKDILSEIRWCRDQALMLRDFAAAVQLSFALGNNLSGPALSALAPWPERPKPPVRKGSKTKKKPRPPARD